MRKYIIDDEEFTDATEAAEHIADQIEYDHDEFDDEINELEGDIVICGLHYSAAYAWQQVDDIAYSCALNEWLDYRRSDDIEDIERELLNMYDGDATDIHGCTVECIDPEEEEDEE